MKHEVSISGMTCQSCVAKVQKALEDIPDVSSAAVTLNPPRAELQSSSTIEPGAIRTALRSAGDYDLGQTNEQAPESRKWLTVYAPLLLVLGFVCGGTALLAFRTGEMSVQSLMRDFMGLFFLAFAFFKLLDVGGFARAFQTYDLIAARSVSYARAYPYIELTLGLCYLAEVMPMLTNAVTLALMLIGTFGVIAALRSKRSIQCACLGSVFDLPMSRVTLIEDLTMAVMALAMLLQGGLIQSGLIQSGI